MFKKGWKKEIFTIPNLLSLLRLGLIPVYAHIYLNAVHPIQFYTAGTVMAASCITDLVDGKIARQFNMVSTLGKILDPLADKITQFTLTICLSMRYPVLIPDLCLFVAKELFQLVMGLHHLFQGKMLPGALTAGKICTTVLFVSLTALVLFPKMHPAAVDVIALTDGIFLLVSFYCYILAYFGKNSMVKDLNENT